tara:strand:+ start:2186 stop:2938 length:753 start_codon:yes stop_codon:yes gene_type:complete
MNITWPKVSICMPTYNRNNFLPLMIFNLQEFIYEDKALLEWVIDDDGTEPLFTSIDHLNEVKKLIYPITINYKYSKDRKSIGVKRNNMVKRANYKHIAMMDSDDIYMPSYIQYSIEIMKKNQKNLVGSNQMLFLYPYNDFIITGIACEAKRQIHEATMVFTKKHWQSMGGFCKTNKGEGAKMIDGADSVCAITDIRLCMMCVCHKDNTIKKDQFLKEDGSNKIDGELNPMIKKLLIKVLSIKPIDDFIIL